MSPYEIPECAGKPYRPSNGTEGMMFHEQFCLRCVHEEYLRTGEDDAKKCELLNNSMLFDPGDEAYPKEWTHDERGRPTCTAFERDWTQP